MWIHNCIISEQFQTSVYRYKLHIILIADCFGIYDLNDDGYISREEMFQMLKNTMVKQPTEEDPDEGIKDIVEIMVKKMVRKNIKTCIQFATFRLFMAVSWLHPYISLSPPPPGPWSWLQSIIGGLSNNHW